MDSTRQVPLFDLAVHNEPLRLEIEAAMRAVVASQHFVLGQQGAAFEAEFAEYCGTRFAVGCASGSDALLLALMALDVGPGDQVVCPAFTFFATASAVSRLGATPVFADVDPRTYDLDPEQTRKTAARCKQLRAVLPVHLFGRVADTDALLAIADEHGVPLVEDAAQSIGATDESGRRSGAIGLAGCFSLYPTKNLGAMGDAGIIVTNDESLAERLLHLRGHGARERYFHREVGINSRLDELQAAVLRVKLRHLDAWNEQRRENARRYDEQLGAAGAVSGAKGAALEDATLPVGTPAPAPHTTGHVYHHYCIRVPAARRDGLKAHLRAHEIGTESYYPLGLHQQECFRELGHRAGDLPETEAAAEEALVLPVHPGVTPEQTDRIVETVVAYLKR